MKVKIRIPTGETHELQVKPQDTIKQLKVSALDLLMLLAVAVGASVRKQPL